MSKDKVIVNSWNEWDPLKHVIVGKADGCYARPTYKSPGSVCLISKGKFIWVSGNVEKRENDWKIQENTSVKR